MSQAKFSPDGMVRNLCDAKSCFPVLLSALLVIALMSVAAIPAFGIPTKFSKGLTINVRQAVAPGYVVATLPDGKTYAIDVDGQIVKSWSSPVPDTTIGYANPLPNRNLLIRIQPTTGNSVQMMEIDQAGNIVWQYTDTAGRNLHHDQQRLHNGNTLMVCSAVITVPPISDKALTDDCLIQADATGKVVWTWQTADHFDEFGFSDADKASIFATAGDWAHMNSAQEIPANANSNDPRFKPGNILVSYRHINMMIIIDPNTNAIVWKADNVTIGQHDAHMLTSDLSGAGNILVFDNGFSNVGNNLGATLQRFYSRVVEINPLDLSIVNEYNEGSSGLPLWWLFAPFVGSAQRLPNGNTLICEGSDGRIFEVMPTGKIVWEWVNRILVDGFQGKSSLVYRAEKVPLGWLLP